MANYYADLIINAKKVNGEIITYERAVKSLINMFGITKADQIKVEIKKILIAKGFANLVK